VRAVRDVLEGWTLVSPRAAEKVAVVTAGIVCGKGEHSMKKHVVPLALMLVLAPLLCWRRRP